MYQSPANGSDYGNLLHLIDFISPLLPCSSFPRTIIFDLQLRLEIRDDNGSSSVEFREIQIQIQIFLGFENNRHPNSKLNIWIQIHKIFSGYPKLKNKLVKLNIIGMRRQHYIISTQELKL